MYLSDYPVENRWGSLLISCNDTEAIRRPDRGRFLDSQGFREEKRGRSRQPATLLMIGMLINGTGGVMFVKLVATGMDDKGALRVQHGQHQHYR